MAINLNVGQIVERVIRRDRMGISELSRKLKVSRRTIYNWFDQEKLNPEIIQKIGAVIGHDFSSELPEVFLKKDLLQVAFDEHTQDPSISDSNSVYFWMNKYIRLLEKYNELLSIYTTDVYINDKDAAIHPNHRDKTLFPLKKM